MQQQNTSPTAGSTSNQKETQTSTTISPAHTMQQQNTSPTAGNGSECKSLNCTSILPTRTTSQQQNTSTTADPQTNLSTPTTSPNTSADTSEGNATKTDISLLITAPQNISTTQSAAISATQPGERNDTTSPPNTTITPLTSTHPSSILHAFTNITGATKFPCQYSLMERENNTTAPVVNIKDFEKQNYTIRIKENHNEIRVQEISNQTAFKILFEWLKPCTVYNISVDGCKPNGSETFISSENGETVPKTVVTNVTEKKVCLKGEFNGIKWNLTECVEITEQNSCTSTHTIKLDKCNYTMNVLMPTVKPNITFKKTIPSKFEWTNKPTQCNAMLNINCTNDENKNGTIYGLNASVSLLPDTLYSCIGVYPYENQSIKSNELSFKINCDWQKNGRFKNTTTDSFEISWNSLDEDKCSGITWDSYSVSCKFYKSHHGNCTKHKNGIGTDCSITNLMPYESYECSIYAEFKSKTYLLFSGMNATLSTKPDFKSVIEVTHPFHNSLDIICENKGTKIVWNGEKGTFMAEITYNGETISKNHTKCSFTFPDLYYLTTYNVKITAENKEGHSAFLKHKATTKYNDKAVIGFLAFLIIVTSVALLFVLFKIYLLKRKRTAEDEEILLTPEPLRRVEPIYADGLVEAYKSKIADEARLFMDEFQSIPRIFSNYTIKEAKKQENQFKNRYVDILP
ncbi:receptor-type tyrosine-protein phosphatase C-like, partial [Sinocyclocheilus grahami]|uniref:receptor-type tyrosine-protein phosphatase C-like n=1 Tax=Sinocyclocheilus grahami TaxID=75366 RepID=UPI0007AC70D9